MVTATGVPRPSQGTKALSARPAGHNFPPNVFSSDLSRAWWCAPPFWHSRRPRQEDLKLKPSLSTLARPYLAIKMGWEGSPGVHLQYPPKEKLRIWVSLACMHCSGDPIPDTPWGCEFRACTGYFIDSPPTAAAGSAGSFDSCLAGTGDPTWGALPLSCPQPFLFF